MPDVGVTTGATCGGLTATVKLCETKLTPPLAVPPLSWTMTVIVVTPLAPATGVKTSVPVVLGLVS